MVNTWIAPTMAHTKDGFTAGKVDKIITVQTGEEDSTV
jgi:hypothetical protein